MEKENLSPSIFDYFDHKLFCRDMFNFKKKTERVWSYEKFARKAGLHKTYLSGIIHQNKKNVGLDQVPRLIKGFSLNLKEGKYFELLIKYNRAKNIDESMSYLKRIFDLKAKKNPIYKLEKEKYDFFSKWYYVALYEIIKTKNFPDINSPSLLADKLKGNLKENQISLAIEKLLELGMIKKDKDKGYVQTKGPIKTKDDNIFNMAIYNFHKEMIELSLNSLNIEGPRELSGLTFAIPQSRLKEVIKKIRSLRKSINQFSESCDECDSVYQLNLHLFPLTNP